MIKKTILDIIDINLITNGVEFLVNMINIGINKRNTYINQLIRDQAVHTMSLGDTKKVIMMIGVILKRKMKNSRNIWI